MRVINIYFNFASKTSAGHLEVEDTGDIEALIRQWITQGYCKCHFQSNRWIYVNWQNVVYVAFDHTHGPAPDQAADPVPEPIPEPPSIVEQPE